MAVTPSHLLSSNNWLPLGSFNLHTSSQISQTHSNPSLFYSWYHCVTILFAVTWTAGRSSCCRTIYPAAQWWHLEASSTSGSCHTEPTLDLELSFQKTKVRLGNIKEIVKRQWKLCQHLFTLIFFQNQDFMSSNEQQKEKLWRMFTMDADWSVQTSESTQKHHKSIIFMNESADVVRKTINDLIFFWYLKNSSAHSRSDILQNGFFVQLLIPFFHFNFSLSINHSVMCFLSYYI